MKAALRLMLSPQSVRARIPQANSTEDAMTSAHCTGSLYTLKGFYRVKGGLSFSRINAIVTQYLEVFKIEQVYNSGEHSKCSN